MTRELEAYYDKIDRFLRNNLYDDNYAEYSEALEALWAAQPAAEPVISMKRSERKSLSKPAMDILNATIGGPNAPYREGQKSIGRDDPRHPLYAQTAQPAAEPVAWKPCVNCYPDQKGTMRHSFGCPNDPGVFLAGAAPAAPPSSRCPDGFQWIMATADEWLAMHKWRAQPAAEPRVTAEDFKLLAQMALDARTAGEVLEETARTCGLDYTQPAAERLTRSQKLASAGFSRRPSLWAMEARQALELIATPMRPDGTWNRDRAACRQIAAEALGRHDEEKL